MKGDRVKPVIIHSLCAEQRGPKPVPLEVGTWNVKGGGCRSEEVKGDRVNKWKLILMVKR